jgi:hypothetical protein
VGRVVLVVVCVLLLAGCGGGAKRACTSPKAERALARLDADLTALEHAAALPTTDSLKGNAAVNRATDRFLLHVETAPIDNLQRNRLIDHAAALVAGSCQQCFQAFEAARPIVSIAHGDLDCPAAFAPQSSAAIFVAKKLTLQEKDRVS